MATSRLQDRQIGSDTSDPYANMPEEQGLEEEGFTDVIKPFKQKLIQAIKEQAPPGEVTELAAEAANLVLPNSPLDVLNPSTDMSPKLRSIVQKVKFPEASQGAKIFKSGENVAREAFNKLSPELQAIKRKEAITNIINKGVPEPSAVVSTPSAAMRKPAPTPRQEPKTVATKQQKKFENLPEEFEVE